MSKDCLISAIIAWNPASYISIENNLTELQQETDLIYSATPEFIYIQKESVLLLSRDAKNLIKFLVDTPKPFNKFIVGKRGEPTKCKLRKFLKNLGWNNSRINSVFKELDHFLCGVV